MIMMINKHVASEACNKEVESNEEVEEGSRFMTAFKQERRLEQNYLSCLVY